MLESLILSNFRNIAGLQLDFHCPSVIFLGANGQGKTSVLEAIHYIGCLRSFRTKNMPELITIGQHKAELAAQVSFGTWRRRYRIELDPVRHLFIDGSSVSKASDFAGAYRMVSFLPDDPEIITGRSMQRRKFFDMFISMLDRDYFAALQQYNTGLRSKNYLLRTHCNDSALLQAYDAVLAKSGSLIARKRTLYTSLLSDCMQENLKRIRPDFSDFRIRMRGSPGEEEVFRQKISVNFERDRQNGYCSFGPQSDDFEFLFDGKLLRLYGSRGQCRIVSFAMKLAEFDVIQNHSISKDNTVVLVDDVTGDLDERVKEAFFDKIKTASQVFYTFTDLHCSQLADQSQIITLSAGKAVQERPCTTQ